MTHLNRLCNKTFKTSFQAAWRRKWQPTPVFLPGESQGHGSLVGCLENPRDMGAWWAAVYGVHRARHE